ncbi:helix-turn-helix domain-containing protein [Subtercola frigoramans]|uniref:helix-turn-helix domain-containing protein n=2 Tax=Subtercola TaxID=120212 RepID=UPI0027DD11A8|nr:helix-turn-helix transcriptional regulator [Subtercola frigoramans]
MSCHSCFIWALFSKHATDPLFVSDVTEDGVTGSSDASGAEQIDLAQLGTILRERRGTLSLRQAAAEVGVSFSTLTRVEAGAQPDLTSFTLICGWLGVSPAQFFMPIAERRVTPMDEVIAHLSADPRLEADAASKIASVLKNMYDVLAKAPTQRPVVACHLRAASALRPGVPHRLNSMLGAMHDKLAERVAAGEL